MQTTPWILISAAILLLVLAVVAVIVKRKTKRPPDYYSFFILGLIWLVIGIPFKNYVLFAMGLVFTIAGLVNKNKWKKNRVHWKDLTKSEKKLRLAITIILGILVLAGLIAFVLTSKK